MDSFWQISIILLCNLSFVGRSVKDRGVVINIIDMNDHSGVVLIQIVTRHKSELVLRKHRQGQAIY